MRTSLFRPACACPRGVVPQLLERPALVAAQPKAAERILQQDEYNAQNEAHGMAADGVKPQAPVVEDEAADDGLPDIVAQAHLAVRQKPRKQAARTGAVVGQRECAYIEKHHREVLPHVEHDGERSLRTLRSEELRHCIAQRTEHGEGRQRPHQRATPHRRVAPLVIEHAPPPEPKAEQEEEERLRETPVFQSPSEVYGQAVAQSRPGNVEPAAALLGREYGDEQVVRAEVERLQAGVYEAAHEIKQLHRLQGQQQSKSQNNAVARPHERQHKQAAHGVDRKNVAVEKQKVEQTEAEEQHHAPREARTEVEAALRLVVVLYEQRQPEQHCEYGVHLVGEHKERNVPHGLVKLGKRREAVEVQVLDEMQHDYAAHGHGAQQVGCVDARVGQRRWLVMCHDIRMFNGKNKCKYTTKI